MTVAGAFTNPEHERLVARFEQAVGAYPTPEYCRLRRGEFLLQRMLLPEIFSGRFNRALEIGCGIGYKSLLLAEIAGNVEGIDMSEPYHGFPGNVPAAVYGQQILGKIGAGRVRLSIAEDFAVYLNERKGAYDLVITDYVLEHVPDPAPLYRAIFDALVPGGVAVHTIPNTHDAMDTLLRLNLGASLKEYAKAVAGFFLGRKRRQKLTLNGLLVPITHSEYISDYREQFDVYKLESYVYPMIEAGFVIERVVPTREHSYTLAARKPGNK